MALLDIFKKKKKESKKKEKKEEAIKTVEEKEGVEKELIPVKKKEAPKRETAKRKVAVVYNIISKPHVSEKSMGLGGINQYIFKVFSEVNKTKIKEAIEAIYRVDVLSVNIINVPNKKRRLGKFQGIKKGYKKAIVKIGAGQKIEIL